MYYAGVIQIGIFFQHGNFLLKISDFTKKPMKPLMYYVVLRDFID